MNESEQLVIPEETVMSKIYEIRGKKVMIDRDLAELYGVETKRLKEQARRNLERFPERYMFELTEEEHIALRSQIATSNKGRGGVRYSPMAFTEHFMFQLTKKEVETMVSQNAIPSKQDLGGTLPYVFTEHGLLQLANVLKSGRATQMSIKIIDVFVRIQKMLLTQKDLLLEVEEIRKKVSGQDEKIELIFNYLRQFIQEKEAPRQRIGFKLPNKN